jgi:RNA polymerase sigma factor (sigma-70 family)
MAHASVRPILDTRPTTAEDLRLYRRCIDGDESALAELYCRYGDLCARRAFTVLHDRVRAAETVHEAFLDFWRTAHQFDPERVSVRTWLCVLVHRRSVDLARREARRRLGDEALATPEPCSSKAEGLLILLGEGRHERTATKAPRETRAQMGDGAPVQRLGPATIRRIPDVNREQLGRLVGAPPFGAPDAPQAA